MIPKGVRTARLDLSNWIWHFVRRGDDETEIFEKIISEKRILATTDIYTKEKVICFTETPLSEHIRQNTFLAKHNYSRLSLSGIGFQRNWLFNQGALPVIYQPNSLLESLPLNQRWRHVGLDLDKPIDFSWQREWRLPKDCLEFSESDAILVVPNVDYLKDILWNADVDFEYEDGQIIYYGGFFKKWNFIPIEHTEINNDQDIELCLGEDFTDIIPEEPDYLDYI